MLSREQLLEEALNDSHGAAVDRELAFSLAQIASASKKFGIGGEGAPEGVVVCLSKMVADEKDALFHCSNPEMHASWHRTNTHGRFSNRTFSYYSSYEGKWGKTPEGREFTDWGLNMGDWEKLLLGKERGAEREDSLMCCAWNQAYSDQYQYGSASSWVAPFVEKVKALVVAPAQNCAALGFAISSETELKSRVYDATLTKLLVDQLANESDSNCGKTNWLDELIDSFSKERWSVLKAGGEITLDTIVAPESVRHVFERLIRTDIDGIAAQVDDIRVPVSEYPYYYGLPYSRPCAPVGSMPAGCRTAVAAFKTAANDIIARKKALATSQAQEEKIEMDNAASIIERAFRGWFGRKRRNELLYERETYQRSNQCRLLKAEEQYATDHLNYLKKRLKKLDLMAKSEKLTNKVKDMERY